MAFLDNLGHMAVAARSTAVMTARTISNCTAVM